MVEEGAHLAGAAALMANTVGDSDKLRQGAARRLALEEENGGIWLVRLPHSRSEG